MDISLEERDVLDFNSSSHNNNSGEETNKKSRLEVLAEETFNQTLTGGSQELVDENIRTFLAEESIVERTQDCKKYFADHVTPVGAAIQVRPKKESYFQKQCKYRLRERFYMKSVHLLHTSRE